MALAGLKKQFNKANQYMNEKIGGVEGTKFTDEFTQLERRTDLTYELVDELINRTKEYLQPNPASRTKLMVSSKLKGAPGKPHSYPQPEGILADAMCKYGKEVNDDSNFAKSLAEMGEALREMAEVKYALEDNVKQNFLEPLTHLQAKDLKDVLFHRKKLEGRRLDYDCKKRKRQKGTHFSEDEIRMAEEKLEESYNLASMGMHNLLQNEIEQLSQICVLSEALYEYHSQCANILESLNARLMEIKNGAAQRTFQPYIPKKLHELNLNVTSIGHDDLSPGDAQMMNDILLLLLLHPPQSTIIRQRKNASSSTHSSPLSIKSGKFSDGFSSNSNSNNNNSTTAYLLREKTGQHKTLSHSKSLLNVSNSNNNTYGGGGPNSVWASWDDNDPPSQTRNDNHTNSGNVIVSGSNKYDLLTSGINFNTTSIDWNQCKTNDNKQTTMNNSNNLSYRNSSYHPSTTTTSPSVESPPTKPTNLFLDTSKANANASPLPSPVRSPARTPTDSRGPCCQALYDFDAENENEISFKEGDIIQLVTQVDENWYEGSVNGRTGLFPVSYVQVLVPI
ncbi:Endophilin-A2, variant 2 [Dermatophagoides farinae]|uniref:Endophilin-A n=1 Tax=Dermatophagoides farinae TaxID=6954 RepID=A0A922HYC5_DERFA|nr:Endophilin-A2, variant 2 [Dermatophagoides farinae]